MSDDFEGTGPVVYTVRVDDLVVYRGRDAESARQILELEGVRQPFSVAVVITSEDV